MATQQKLYIVDTITGEGQRLQNVPKDIEYDPASKFSAIATCARNNPIYQYTGSEDIITLELDWYCDDAQRTDVIKACRWVESLTKNDGYTDGPHPIILSFGDVFKNVIWICTSAPYTMSLFDGVYGMMPRQAYQKCTFKKITDHNLTRAEIQFFDTPIPIV